MALENVQDIYPVSPLQAGMLFHSIESPDPAVYVLQIRVPLEGPLHGEDLAAAWDEVVHRHDALRAAFLWEELDQPLQAIHERVSVPWRRIDGRRLLAEGGPGAIDDWLTTDRRAGFDLTDVPLMRVTLIEIEDERHLLVWTLHHLLADAWSVAIVLQELKAAYDARRASRAFSRDPAPSYRDFIAWMTSRDVEAARPAWQRHLEGVTERTRLDLGPVVAEGGEGGRRVHEARLSSGAAEALARAARECRVTQTALFKVAWASVLAGHTGRSDIVFGLVVSGRSHDLPGAERAVGLYMNTLPSRVRLESAPSLRALVQAVHAEGLELRPHENTPLGRIQAWSGLPLGTPLFDSLLIVENHPPADREPNEEGLRFGVVDPMDQSNYPLAAFVIPGDDLRLLTLSDPVAVPPETAGRILEQFETALERLPFSLGDAPRSLAVLPGDEQARLDDLATEALPAEVDRRPVHQQIAEAARRQPDRVAVVAGGDGLRYDELEARAAAWSGRLTAAGVGRGDRVALLLERGTAVVVAMLATLKSGAAYVPLDASYPAARLRRVLDDCQPRVTITSRSLRDQHRPAGRVLLLEDLDGEGGPEAGAGPAADGEDPAYVMYTSGSTGRPKGVVVSHGSLSYSTGARVAFYGPEPPTFLLLSSFAFDSSVAGLYWTLTTGGTLVVSEPGLESDVARLGETVEGHGVTHTLCLPSLYEVILDLARPGSLASLRTVIVAGEAFPGGLIRRHRARLPGVSLFNEYGPTEACVWCTVCDTSSLDGEAAAPIGRPIPGAEVRLLAPDGRPAPLGAVGEIAIGGPGLAEGYLGQPEATAAAFSSEGGTGGRLYRSGDLGRYRPDGSLEFLGRRDHQVKIRGHRVEIAEIETALRRQPAVRDAVVAAVPRAPGGGGATAEARLALVAFVVPEPDAGSPASEDLRQSLREELPAFMVPATVGVVESFPRLPNGKVDLALLLRSAATPLSENESSETPRDDFERNLAEVWQSVLGVESVGIRDDFFALGGDSIASIRIVALARQRGLALVPSEVFEFPSIAELSESRGRAAGVAPRPGRVLPAAGAPAGSGAPLFMVHGGRRMLMQLADTLRVDRAVHLLMDHRDAGDVSPFASIDSLAEEYLRAIREIQAGPPALLGGYSIGAPIVVEMALRLREQGQPPSLVFLLDPPDDPYNFRSAAGFELAPATGSSPEGAPRAESRGAADLIRFAAAATFRLLGLQPPLGLRRTYVAKVYDRALRRHPLRPYPGPVLIFHSSDARQDREGRTLWQFLEGEHAETVRFEATHTEFVRRPEVIDEWSRSLAARLAARDPTGGSSAGGG